MYVPAMGPNVCVLSAWSEIHQAGTRGPRAFDVGPQRWVQVSQRDPGVDGPQLLEHAIPWRCTRGSVRLVSERAHLLDDRARWAPRRQPLRHLGLCGARRTACEFATHDETRLPRTRSTTHSVRGSVHNDSAAIEPARKKAMEAIRWTTAATLQQRTAQDTT